MRDLHTGSLDPSRQICVPKLAQLLGCTIPKAQTLIRTGRIPGHKNPHGWVTTAAAVERYLAEHSALQSYKSRH